MVGEFEITVSRHAKRRIKLYKIAEIDIINSIRKYLSEKKFIIGSHEIVDYELAKKYSLPVKICFAIKDGQIVIITAYLLKGKKNREKS
jgi:hypothetical protein